jgi:histidinol-phosphatase (PHP family)
LIDYHIHTSFSCDSRLDPHEVCTRAIALGIEEIAFTEHLDFDPLDEGYGHYDYAAISESILSLRDSFRDRLTIRKGIEITYQKKREDEIARFVEGKDFDFVMGSIHLVGSFDISQDMGTEQFFLRQKREEALFSYFKTTLDLACCGIFDILGHFEMIRRYALSYATDYSYGEYSDIIDEILSKLIAGDTALEVNTSGLRHLPKQPYPRPEILKRYLALGGRHVTIGSDSHLPEHIGYRILEMMRELREMGVPYLTTFQQRKKGMKNV